MTAEQAVQHVLGDIEEWKRPYAKDAIREALLNRAAHRYVAKYGVPPVATPSTDHACWQLLTDLEKRVWLALDD